MMLGVIDSPSSKIVVTKYMQLILVTSSLICMKFVDQSKFNKKSLPNYKHEVHIACFSDVIAKIVGVEVIPSKYFEIIQVSHCLCHI